jgi:hypothetical protein
MYSASIVDWTTTSCKVALQLTTQSPKLNIYNCKGSSLIQIKRKI